MSFGRATYTPSIAPTVRSPSQTPMFNFPGATTTYTQAPAAQAYYPMPDYVAKNINLGWDYARGQVIQPLTAQQRAAVYIPPINLPALTQAPAVYPTVKTMAPGTGFFNQSLQMPQSVPVSKAPATTVTTKGK